ncbi:MAG: hypothetical protein KBT03_09260 [Bacteroidales bacterium]|nr:hypothetical protein [Candidatus Scybalousia scybalohippi]
MQGQRMNAVQRANKKIDQELKRHIEMVYSAVAIIFWKEYGWRKLRITRLFEETQEVWQECADSGVAESMLSMLENETGIEIKMPGMKSYHEYAYLDADAWDKKPPTEMQVLYIRQQQSKWLPAMMVANICLALYRKEKWGAERIARFVSMFEELKAEYGANTKIYKEELEKLTDFTKNEVCSFAKK